MNSIRALELSVRHHKTQWLMGFVGLIVLVVFVGRLLPVTRADYSAYDLQSKFWRRMFGGEYDKAVAENQAWVQDAQAVALRVAGYPNPDGTKPEKITVVLQASTKSTIVVTSGKLMDDSISKQEIWVEMVRQGDIWVVEWAGYRQQCQRSALSGWIAGPCS